MKLNIYLIELIGNGKQKLILDIVQKEKVPFQTARQIQIAVPINRVTDTKARSLRHYPPERLQTENLPIVG